VHALRNIHSALVPDGLLVDTQPVSAHPRVVASGAELGELDMREWIETICAVDRRMSETLAEGLYELAAEREFVVLSRFDDGADCLDVIGCWQGTRVPQVLADRLAGTDDDVVVEQRVRLRVLRRGRD